MPVFGSRSGADKEFRKQLKHVLGFKPGNLEFYIRAFTHKSASQEIKEGFRDSNERLEFLGDAILDSIVANYFFQRFPFEEEGFLTQVKAKMVNRGHLNKLAMQLGMNHLLRANIQGDSKTIYGDAFEALIGAIYLDKGFKATEQFVIRKVINPLVDVEELITTETNFKSLVLEYCQKNKLSIGYHLKQMGSDQPYYEATIMINNKPYTTGKGKSKKRAEQYAAKHYYEQHLQERSN